jgi:hypothetical protein
VAADHLHLVEPGLVALEGPHARLIHRLLRRVRVADLDNRLGRLQSASGRPNLGRETNVLKH